MASGKQYTMEFMLNAALSGGFSGSFSKAQQTLQKMQSEIQALNRTQSDVSAYQKQQAAVDATNNKLSVLQQQYDNIQREINETGTYSSDLENKLLSKQQQIDKTSSSLQQQTDKLNQMGNALREAGVDTDHLADESKRLESEMSELKKKQEEVADSADLFGDKSIAAITGLQQALVAAGITKLMHELGEAFMDCVNLAADFEETMSAVEAISGADAQGMAELAAMAKELGATTKFTAQQSGEAMSYMAMAGWDVQDMLSGMPGVLSLAAASGEDLAMVSDIVTDSLTAFGLTAADSGHFSDVLAAAAANANTNVSIMGETMKMSASVAGALGYSIEDVAVAMGLMANSGVKGSIAGTALRNTFNGLLSGVTLTGQAFGEYEYTAVRADGTMKDFGATINELRVYFDQMTEAERVANAQAIAGQRGYNGLLAILNATDADYQKLTDSINNCAGAAEHMADIRMDNMKGQLTLLQSAWEALRVTIGENSTGAMRDVYSALTDVTTGINSFLSQHPTLVKALTSIAIGVGALVAGLTGFATVTKVIIPLVTKLGPALMSLNASLGPAGWLVLGLTAVTAAGLAFAGMMHTSADASETFTATTQAQYQQLSELESAYKAACDTYGDTSDEAAKLKYQIDELNTSLSANGQTLEQSRSAVEGFVSSYEQGNEEHEKTTAGIHEQYLQQLSLIAKLKDLASQTDVTAASQEMMQQILNDLNGSIGTVSYSYEDLVGNSKAVIDAYQNIAEAQERTEQRKADWDDYVRQGGAALEAKEKLEAAQTELAAAEKAYNTAASAYQQMQQPGPAGSPGNLFAFLTPEHDAYVNALAALETAQQNVNDLNAAYQKINGTLDEYEQKWGWGSTADQDFEQLQGALDSTYESLVNLAAAYNVAYQAALESFEGQFGLFDKAQADTQATVANAQAALDSQLAYWQNYAANIETLRSVSAADLGVTQENYDKLIAFVSSGNEEAAGLAASMVQQLNSGNQEALTNMVNTFSEVQSAQAAAAEQTAAWTTGLSEQTDQLVKDMVSSIEQLDVSDEAAAAAQSTINAYIATANSMQGPVSDAFAALASAASSALNSGGSGPKKPGKGTGAKRNSAVGTLNAHRGYYLVGEEGPEIVWMDGGEQITNARESQLILDNMEAHRKLLEQAAANSGAEPSAIPNDISQIITLSPVLMAAMQPTPAVVPVQAEQTDRTAESRVPVPVNVTFNIAGDVTQETMDRLEDYGDDFTERVRRVIEEVQEDRDRSEYR